MYVYTGQEPPVIEEPDPRFGEVLIKLNQMSYQLHDSITEFNETTREKLDTFTRDMASFIDQIVVPINTHIAIIGAAHHESKKTIGLGKKDNYRTATFAEQRDLVPVLAYVTPQGAKASVVKNSASFNVNAYQMNDAFQFAAYFYPDEYPVGIPTVIQGTRYFSASPLVPLLTNGDRLVASPASDTGQYQKQSIFFSGPQNIRRKTQMSEIQNLNTNYIGNNWNAAGAETAEGKVALFKPLADKKIYEMKSALAMSGTNRNYLLYDGYGTATYKGLATAVAVSGTVVTLQHKFFRTNLLETDPTLVDLVDGSYQALFTQINKAPYAGAANGSHSYNLFDFVNVTAGQSLALDGQVVTGLTWNTQDYEAYLFVAIPVIVSQGGKSSKLIISFTESIIPGKLAAGSSASFRQIGTLTKDTIGADMLPVAGAQWTKVNNLTDMNNPVVMPGVILPSGEVVKAATTRNAIRIKRMESGFSELKTWMLGNRQPVDVKTARTEVFAPSRHAPLGPVPERILPMLHDTTGTYYLVYGLDEVSGQYEWKEFIWASGAMIGAQTAAKFGLNMAVSELPLNSATPVPQSLSIYVSLTANGSVVRGMAFTNENQFTGFDSVAYANKTLTIGAKIKLSQSSLATLRATASAVIARGELANPGTNKALREAHIQVFALTASRAIVMVSDGVNYAEATVVPYTVTGSTFTLVIPTGGFVFTPVTPSGMVTTGNSRKSISGDGVWVACSDLLAIQTSANAYNVVISRPFGSVYGDVSFSIPNIAAPVPTITPGKTNPARLYANTQQIDLVDELHPPLLIPLKGVYQFNPGNTRYSTLLTDVTSGMGVDPYDVNEAGWVRIPAGIRMMLSGRAYILEREYPIKVNPAGVTYCYLSRQGDVLQAIGSPIIRETANNEVMIGTSTNGILKIDHSYLVLDKHIVSPNRRGSAVPAFDEDGGNGTNKFFTRRDLI